MQGQHLTDLIADPVQWRQGSHRFLKDHRNPVSPNIADLARGQAQQISAVSPGAEIDGSAAQLRRPGQNAQNRTTGQSFP